MACFMVYTATCMAYGIIDKRVVANDTIVKRKRSSFRRLGSICYDNTASNGCTYTLLKPDIHIAGRRPLVHLGLVVTTRCQVCEVVGNALCRLAVWIYGSKVETEPWFSYILLEFRHYPGIIKLQRIEPVHLRYQCIY